MMPTRLLRVALVALAVLGVACGDPTLAKATYASGLASSTLYALTGAPATVPTALSFLTGVKHADGNFAFDVAFDLDASGVRSSCPCVCRGRRGGHEEARGSAGHDRRFQ
jgi:hypothetical protein